jgi:hypothetical protein
MATTAEARMNTPAIEHTVIRIGFRDLDELPDGDVEAFSDVLPPRGVDAGVGLDAAGSAAFIGVCGAAGALDDVEFSGVVIVEFLIAVPLFGNVD